MNAHAAARVNDKLDRLRERLRRVRHLARTHHLNNHDARKTIREIEREISRYEGRTA